MTSSASPSGSTNPPSPQRTSLLQNKCGKGLCCVAAVLFFVSIWLLTLHPCASCFNQSSNVTATTDPQGSTTATAGPQSTTTSDTQGSNVLADLKFDIVSLALKPSCVGRKTVKALNTFIQPKVRYIHIITGAPAQCHMFESFAAKVRCHDEEILLPGLNFTLFSNYMAQKGFSDHKRHSWYYQQVLKLGVFKSKLDLSPLYMIWDIDMILLRPYPVVRAVLHLDGTTQLQTKVNFGGFSYPGYFVSYKRLFNRDISRAPDSSSFVTHHMVVQQDLMREFLEQITFAAHRNDSYGWVWSIVESIDKSNAFIGFSEYWTYQSWLYQKHKDRIFLVNRANWVRHPVKTFPTVFAGAVDAKGKQIKQCCPVKSILKGPKEKGYDFIGFEIGHQKDCKYSDKLFSESYAADFTDEFEAVSTAS